MSPLFPSSYMEDFESGIKSFLKENDLSYLIHFGLGGLWGSTDYHFVFGIKDHSSMGMTNQSYNGIPHGVLTNRSDFNSVSYLNRNFERFTNTYPFHFHIRSAEFRKWHSTDMKKNHSAFDIFSCWGGSWTHIYGQNYNLTNKQLFS